MTEKTRVTGDPRLYVRITENLRAKISRGAIQADLPISITYVSQEWGTSRQTVSKALRALEKDGLVRWYPGVGYYVRSRIASPDATPENGETPVNDTLPAFERTHLERLKLAAEVILGEQDAIPDPLEAELTLFRDRVEHALLLPGRPGQ